MKFDIIDIYKKILNEEMDIGPKAMTLEEAKQSITIEAPEGYSIMSFKIPIDWVEGCEHAADCAYGVFISVVKSYQGEDTTWNETDQKYDYGFSSGTEVVMNAGYAIFGYCAENQSFYDLTNCVSEDIARSIAEEINYKVYQTELESNGVCLAPSEFTPEFDFTK